MYNKAILMGRLARDPELRSFANGGSVCKLRLITSRTWRNQDSGEWQEKVEGHNVAVYVEGLANRIAEACRKGDVLMVEGPMETRSWTGSDGTARYLTEIAVRPRLGTVRRVPAGRGAEGPAPIAPADTHDAPEDDLSQADPQADVFDDWLTDDLESDGGDFPF